MASDPKPDLQLLPSSSVLRPATWYPSFCFSTAPASNSSKCGMAGTDPVPGRALAHTLKFLSWLQAILWVRTCPISSVSCV